MTGPSGPQKPQQRAAITARPKTTRTSSSRLIRLRRSAAWNLARWKLSSPVHGLAGRAP
jgi:hypothetical protein